MDYPELSCSQTWKRFPDTDEKIADTTEKQVRDFVDNNKPIKDFTQELNTE